MKNFPLTLFFVRLRFINHGLVLIALENPVCIACLAFLFRWSSPGGWWSLGHPLSCNAFAGTVPARRLGHPLSEDGSLPISLYHLNSNKSLELPCSNKNMLLFGRAGKICKWEIKSAVYTSCISVWNSISKLFQCWKWWVLVMGLTELKYVFEMLSWGRKIMNQWVFPDHCWEIKRDLLWCLRKWVLSVCHKNPVF